MRVAEAADGKFVHVETTHDESCCRHDDIAPLSMASGKFHQDYLRDSSHLQGMNRYEQESYAICCSSFCVKSLVKDDKAHGIGLSFG